jgi:hypothetical protein
VLPLIVLVGVMSLGFTGGGLYILLVQQNGERATARVTSCQHRIRPQSITCRGSWVEGGSLLEGGRVVLGTIDGANSGDVGKRIKVRLSGGRAYTESKRLPVILIVIGLLFALGGAWEVRKQLSGSPPAGNTA